VPDRIRQSFVIFDIQTLTLKAERQSAWMSKNYKRRLNPVLLRMLYSCIRMATVDVRGLNVCFQPKEETTDRCCERQRWYWQRSPAAAAHCVISFTSHVRCLLSSIISQMSHLILI